MVTADMRAFLKHDGVLAVLLIKDGSVLEKAGSHGTDTEGLVASLSLLMNESGMIAERLRDRSIPMVFLEFEKKLLMIQALDEEKFMAIITRTDANIGQIIYGLIKVKRGSGT